MKDKPNIFLSIILMLIGIGGIYLTFQIGYAQGLNAGSRSQTENTCDLIKYSFLEYLGNDSFTGQVKSNAKGIEKFNFTMQKGDIFTFELESCQNIIGES